ncbi:MAG: hypothetical protein GX221_04480 [Candidatus Riflebacteria bacterium]|nr:hypothetical protein [Candidatus Riflebacteria bacterium]
MYKIKTRKTLSIVLTVTMLAMIFATPHTAEAGLLGSMLAAIRPYGDVIGKVGGTLAGASICSAFYPPLGTLIGGILGYSVGGIIGRYMTGSLTNIAVIAGAGVGLSAMASMGPIGYIIGPLLGGFLGKLAMNLIYRIDAAATGGKLFAPAERSSTATTKTTSVQALPAKVPAASTSLPPVYSATTVQAPVLEEEKIVDADTKARLAAERYQKAYKTYVNATRSNVSAKDLETVHKEYLDAYQNYQEVIGKSPSY